MASDDKLKRWEIGRRLLRCYAAALAVVRSVLVVVRLLDARYQSAARNVVAALVCVAMVVWVLAPIRRRDGRPMDAKQPENPQRQVAADPRRVIRRSVFLAAVPLFWVSIGTTRSLPSTSIGAQIAGTVFWVAVTGALVVSRLVSDDQWLVAEGDELRLVVRNAHRNPLLHDKPMRVWRREDLESCSLRRHVLRFEGVHELPRGRRSLNTNLFDDSEVIALIAGWGLPCEYQPTQRRTER
jgi:hypothetical protein